MSSVLLGFVGDVLINRDEPDDVFGEVQEVLRAPSVMFANLEGVYTDAPRRIPGILGECVGKARNLDAYARAHFRVMSLANNHILDDGYETMLENRSRLQALGVRTCGAGASLTEAREPAIVEEGGLRIAYLSYASVFPLGHEARKDSPGLAPMRAYSFWRDPYPNVHVPGKIPLVTTVPDERDVAHLKDDIRRAREMADVVIASFHWGDVSRPYHLTDHERRTARLCIDEGAHMVVGHHHHALRGVEWYRGKPILYGLGHFVFDLPLRWTRVELQTLLAELDPSGQSRTSYTTTPRAGWPFLPMHEDTRMTMLAWATAERQGIVDIGFLACHLTADGLIHPLRLGTPDSDKVVAYLEACNRTQGIESRFTPEGAASLAGYATLRVVG